VQTAKHRRGQNTKHEHVSIKKNTNAVASHQTLMHLIINANEHLPNSL